MLWVGRNWMIVKMRYVEKNWQKIMLQKCFDIINITNCPYLQICRWNPNNLASLKTWHILPLLQVQASKFYLHISYFLQNCKIRHNGYQSPMLNFCGYLHQIWKNRSSKKWWYRIDFKERQLLCSLLCITGFLSH